MTYMVLQAHHRYQNHTHIVVDIYLWSTRTVFDFSSRAIMTENNLFGYTFNCAAQFPCRILYICLQVVVVVVVVVPFEVACGLGVYSNWVHIRAVLH